MSRPIFILSFCTLTVYSCLAGRLKEMQHVSSGASPAKHKKWNQVLLSQLNTSFSEYTLVSLCPFVRRLHTVIQIEKQTHKLKKDVTDFITHHAATDQSTLLWSRLLLNSLEPIDASFPAIHADIEQDAQEALNILKKCFLAATHYGLSYTRRYFYDFSVKKNLQSIIIKRSSDLLHAHYQAQSRTCRPRFTDKKLSELVHRISALSYRIHGLTDSFPDAPERSEEYPQKRGRFEDAFSTPLSYTE